MFPIINDLKKYRVANPTEALLVDDFINFLNQKKEQPFSRENLSRHITASAWLLNPNETKALLTHHRKLNIWIQLGGHCDGSSDVLSSALREAEEESGIIGIEPLLLSIFDIDKHLIPKIALEPEHFHYDIRFIFKAPHENFIISNESKELGWFELNDSFFSSERALSIMRMHQKWKDL
ncbi:MAG: family hydrolase [Bacteriovoracaceae bacterium]|nr:family hydrolase [Bacteriovoracaceae bacterium]